MRTRVPQPCDLLRVCQKLLCPYCRRNLKQERQLYDEFILSVAKSNRRYLNVKVLGSRRKEISLKLCGEEKICLWGLGCFNLLGLKGSLDMPEIEDVGTRLLTNNAGDISRLRRDFIPPLSKRHQERNV